MNTAEDISVEEIKEESPQQSAEPENLGAVKEDSVSTLRNFVGKNVSEDDCKNIFSMYDLDNDSVLQRGDLHRMLLDLANAMDFPPCVPNESVEKVLSELVLNVESTGTVSWIEFKSFFVYLQQSPLEHLFEVMTSVFASKDLSNAIIVRFKISDPDAPEEESQNSKQQQQQPENNGVELQNVPDLVAIKEVISAEFAEEGSVNRVFAVHHPQTSIIEALVVFERPEPVVHALEKDGQPILQSPNCEVRKYENQRFPSIPRSGKHTRTASVLAEGYLFGESAVSKVKNVDDKYEISKKVSNTAQVAVAGVTSAAKSVDESLKIRETAGHIATVVSDSAKDFDEKHQVSKTVTEKTAQIDEKLKISENVGKAKIGLKSAADAVVANEHVKSGWGFVTGLASSVSRSMLGIQAETMEIVKEKKEVTESEKALGGPDGENSHEGQTPQNDPDVVLLEEQKEQNS